MVPKNPVMAAGEARASRTFGESIERLIGRLLLAGSVTMAGPLVTGCAPEAAPVDVDTESSAILGGGGADWAQREGRRDTSMVSYLGSYWQESTDCGYRGGCQTVRVIVKLKVKQVAGADLNWKRVGVVYRTASGQQATALGNYFTSWNDGYEEWHVPFSVRAWETGIFTFDAWYQDGAGHTFVDDNNGDLHALKLQYATPVVYEVRDWSNVTVDSTGVSGHLAVRLADLDYEKDLRLVWTTDGWNTVNEFAVGSRDDLNRWYWLSDENDAFEDWAIDLHIPGAATRFEYAIVYRHGIGSGDRVYEFWDNNWGSNYVVDAPPPIIQ